MIWFYEFAHKRQLVYNFDARETTRKSEMSNIDRWNIKDGRFYYYYYCCPHCVLAGWHHRTHNSYFVLFNFASSRVFVLFTCHFVFVVIFTFLLFLWFPCTSIRFAMDSGYCHCAISVDDDDGAQCIKYKVWNGPRLSNKQTHILLCHLSAFKIHNVVQDVIGCSTCTLCSGDGAAAELERWW